MNKETAYVMVTDGFLKMLWDDMEMTFQEYLKSKNCEQIVMLEKLNDTISVWGIKHPKIKESGDYDLLISRKWGSIKFQKK